MGVKKLTVAEVAALKAECPVWLLMPEKVYVCGDFYASKADGRWCYVVVHKENLKMEGWRAGGLAKTLKGVGEVAGNMANEYKCLLRFDKGVTTLVALAEKRYGYYMAKVRKAA